MRAFVMHGSATTPKRRRRRRRIIRRVYREPQPAKRGFKPEP